MSKEPAIPSKTPTYDALPKRERRLVDAYFANGMVQWKAYRDTIYSGNGDDPSKADTIRQLASRKFTDANITGAIEERLKLSCMSADEALTRLAEHARAEYSQYFDEHGSVDIAGMIEDGKAHLIKETDYKGKDADRLVVKFHDVQGALDKLLKAHGAYGATGRPGDEHQHTVEHRWVKE